MITILNKHEIKTYLKSFQNIRYFFNDFTFKMQFIICDYDFYRKQTKRTCYCH